jgi:TonB family protein
MKTLITALLLFNVFCMAQDHDTTVMRGAQDHDTTAVRGAQERDIAAMTTAQDRNDFVAVEKMPTPILNPAPHYPDSARRSGIEGFVWVKVFVTEQGKPSKVEVLKTDNPIFNEPTIAAAMQWTFKPAISHNQPVAVWVTIPFKFKLAKDGAGRPGETKQQPTPMIKPVTK